jgi:hypothetical protein
MQKIGLDNKGRIDYQGELSPINDVDLMEKKYHRSAFQLTADDFEPAYNLND